MSSHFDYNNYDVDYNPDESAEHKASITSEKINQAREAIRAEAEAKIAVECNFVCRITHLPNGSTMLMLNRVFREENPPKVVHFFEYNDCVYLTFNQPKCFSYPRTIQRAGRNLVSMRVPIPTQLRKKLNLNQYEYADLTREKEGVFKCQFRKRQNYMFVDYDDVF